MNEYADALATNLTQTEVFIHLNDFVDEDAIVIGSAGSLPGDMQRLWNPVKENTYHWNTVILVWAMKSLVRWA